MTVNLNPKCNGILLTKRKTKDQPKVCPDNAYNDQVKIFNEKVTWNHKKGKSRIKLQNGNRSADKENSVAECHCAIYIAFFST